MSDVLNYGMGVYGADADGLLLKLGSLLSGRELEVFWETEIGWECDKAVALRKFSEKLNWAETRAKESGWEAIDG